MMQLWDTPAELVERWSSETLAHLYDLVHSPQAEASGVSVRLVHSYAHDGEHMKLLASWGCCGAHAR